MSRDETRDEPESPQAEAEDYWTIVAMRRFGGSFVEALGEAALRADSWNMARLKKAFPDYFHKYAELGATLKKEEHGA